MTNQKRIFITGTDTDVGKTLVTSCLVEELQKNNFSVTAIKPIAAGCEQIDGQLVNSDALLLQKSMRQNIDYEKVNPVALKLAVAPHIAASEENMNLNVEFLQAKCAIVQFETDFLLVEGAGGWLVPLNDSETLADFVVAESLDVVLVVGMKLGCINHALLTMQSIQSSGSNVIGWVANCIDPDMSVVEENIQTLIERLDIPLIATIPYLQTENLVQDAVNYVNIAPLLS